jgi:hypothetical protein
MARKTEDVVKGGEKKSKGHYGTTASSWKRRKDSSEKASI